MGKTGWRQARALRRLLPTLRPQVVVTSAVLRALQTARAMGFKGRVTVVPAAREVASCPCNYPIDIRRAISGDLHKEFGHYDWSLPIKDLEEAGGARKYQRQVSYSDGTNRIIQ